jgi:hypothetical protein
MPISRPFFWRSDKSAGGQIAVRQLCASFQRVGASRSAKDFVDLSNFRCITVLPVCTALEFIGVRFPQSATP